VTSGAWEKIRVNAPKKTTKAREQKKSQCGPEMLNKQRSKEPGLNFGKH